VKNRAALTRNLSVAILIASIIFIVFMLNLGYQVYETRERVENKVSEISLLSRIKSDLRRPKAESYADLAARYCTELGPSKPQRDYQFISSLLQEFDQLDAQVSSDPFMIARIEKGVQDIRSELSVDSENLGSAWTQSLILGVLGCLFAVITGAFALLLSRNQRMLEMQNTRLIGEKKRTEELVRQRSLFMSHVAHEIKSPINAIHSLLDMQNDLEEGPEKQELMELVESQSEKLDELVHSYLDYSKMKAGKMKLNMTPFNIRKELEILGEVYRKQIENSDLDFELYIDPNLGDGVITDGLKLTQILRNLLDNALKHTREGSIRLSVHGLSEGNGSCELQFIVQDSGEGIAENNRDTWFTEFEQLEENFQGVKGSGLGLWIVKGFVELFGGQISIDSVPGEGTTISFTISCEKIHTLEVSRVKEPAALKNIS
jgi:signal transduction histidine kinase